MLATGAAPVRPGVDGADGPGVRVLRTAASSEDLASVTGPETRVVVVGAGFIGCEAAVSLARRGAARHARRGRGASRRSAASARRRRAHRLAGCSEEGVELLLGAPIDAIDPGPTSSWATVRIAADVVLLGSGVEPRDELARGAGLALGPDGRHVAVDATMATSAPGGAGGRRRRRSPVMRSRAARCTSSTGATRSPTARSRAAGSRGTPRRSGTACPASGRRSGIGRLKYAAWGDGYDSVAARVRRRGVHRLVSPGRPARRRARPRPRRGLRRGAERIAADAVT